MAENETRVALYFYEWVWIEAEKQRSIYKR